MEQETDFKPKSLDDVMNPETPVPPEEVKPETPPDEPKEPVETPDAEAAKADGEQEETPKGDEKPDETPASDDPKDEAKPEPTVPVSALQDERRKRQELANRLSAIEQQQAQAARPDPELDPEGAADFDRQQNAQSAFKLRVDMSQVMMRKLHDDYDEVEAIFMEEAANNPALQTQLASHPMPADFAYTEGQRLQKLKEMGDDPVAYIEQVKAEATKAAKEAVIAEMKKAQDDAAKAALPESLAEAPSASEKEANKWSGPKPLKDLIG